ncbi:polyprenyl synthetase family protein [Streptomyces sp. NPDC088258]|uniref:polyprenyl synthetase family protein n=1 Tax=Streptomyces sp. NPDC088258 TaxID=3365849 RepID=UPI0037F2B8F6
MKPGLAPMRGYPIGFIGESGERGRTDTRKPTRASLTMAVADGFGIRPGDVRVRAAVETPHNAALLHDDIADSDHPRRGRPRVRHSA